MIYLCDRCHKELPKRTSGADTYAATKDFSVRINFKPWWLSTTTEHAVMNLCLCDECAADAYKVVNDWAYALGKNKMVEDAEK